MRVTVTGSRPVTVFLLFGCRKDPNNLVHLIYSSLSSSIALHITIQENIFVIVKKSFKKVKKAMALLSAAKISKNSNILSYS